MCRIAAARLERARTCLALLKLDISWNLAFWFFCKCTRRLSQKQNSKIPLNVQFSPSENWTFNGILRFQAPRNEIRFPVPVEIPKVVPLNYKVGLESKKSKQITTRESRHALFLHTLLERPAAPDEALHVCHHGNGAADAADRRRVQPSAAPVHRQQ